LERSTVRMEGLLEGFFDWHNNFLDMALIQPGLFIDYSLYPYRLGLWQMGITLAGIAAVVFVFIRRSKPNAKARRLALWGMIVLVLSVAMTLSLSSWVYEHVPLLAYMQFPWRWLSIVALTSALVGAYIIDIWNNAPWRTLLSAGLVFLTGFTALVTLHPEFFPLTEAEITPARLNEAEFFSGDIGTTVRADYIPAAAHPRPVTGPAVLNDYRLKVIDGQADGEQVARWVNRQEWYITVLSDQVIVAIPTLYWPGWKAILD